ncbi:MAG: hypothetical protein ACP5UN_03840 [Candidatus Micrarchaeia archaeon]
MIDPKYAEIAIKALDKMLKLNVDTTELEKESKIIEKKVQEIIRKNKDTHDTYKKIASNQYQNDNNPMYG